jgi:hypothetical protein
MSEMKPEHFSYSALSDARRQYYSALQHSCSSELDPKTSFWVITMNGWNELRRDVELQMVLRLGPSRRKELMGLPVRVTVDDEPDVPMIQLVMEPKVSPTR